MNWQYEQPVQIRFGHGCLDTLGQEIAAAGYTRGLLVCDPYLVQNGLADRLTALSGGTLVEVFSDVTPNPLTREADACAARLRAISADFAVAAGGGSTMDCAKAACAAAPLGCSIRAYHTGGEQLPGGSLPLLAIPTTAGTGSEVTGVSVLCDEESGVKAPLSHPSLYPKTVFIDPLLTHSVPPRVTASTGLDVLAHALESFWSVKHQPVCDALALHAARLVFENLLPAYEDGNNAAAREKLCEASVIAGLAFALPKTAAAHACSFALTARYGIPHGEACAFTLAKLCSINAKAENGRLDSFAQQLGFADAAAMGKRIDKLKRAMGMVCSLAEAGIPLTQVRELALQCEHPNMRNNPVPMSTNDVERLLLELE